MENFEPQNIKKIAIFQALQLGDLLCSLPSIRALNEFFPESKIILVGLPWAKDFTKRFNKYFDGFMEFPGFPGLPEQKINPQKITNFLLKIQREKFDLALQMQGESTTANSLIELFGAKFTAGFYRKGSYKPKSKLFILYPDNVHEIRKHLKLVRHLGAETENEEVEFPTSLSEKDEYFEILNKYHLYPFKYVLIHPGARDPKKRWDFKKFALVGDFLAEKGFKVVLTGTPDEEDVIKKVKKSMANRSINLCAKTGIGALTELLKTSSLFVTNDTGISHIASATKTPSVIIFSNYSEPIRWAPLDKKKHIAIAPFEAMDLMNVTSAINKLVRKEFFYQPDLLELQKEFYL